MTDPSDRPHPPAQGAPERRLAELILEYARDLRRNSSGGDDYPWEYAKGTADYLEELVRRSGVEVNMNHAILSENAGQVLPDLGPDWCPENPHIAGMFRGRKLETQNKETEPTSVFRVLAAQPSAAPVETRSFSARENLHEVLAEVRADIDVATMRETLADRAETTPVDGKFGTRLFAMSDAERDLVVRLLRGQPVYRSSAGTSGQEG